ncbi:hypothetical protein E2C01_066228 [Portunus trituberculatus]|uniref:Uncharacterized protein n=1 Tax=Portunus trituberculatus TaxID=210409 RepID=A0A5B7HPQ0_PORTR|nr:hypothetical protein [Portunus trituberculatus]
MARSAVNISRVATAACLSRSPPPSASLPASVTPPRTRRSKMPCAPPPWGCTARTLPHSHGYGNTPLC